MKILQVNKYFYEKGGSERYLFLLNDSLTAHGADVCVFSMKHDRNFPCRTEKYFVDAVDFKQLSVGQRLRSMVRPFYSPEVRMKLRRIIQDERPDVAHLHNLSFHLTSSVISVLQEQRIPFVTTLHDFAYFAPNFTLTCRQGLCSHLRPRAQFQWRAVLHRCYDQSFAKSLIGGIDIAIHRSRYLSGATFIAPSQAIANRFIEFGWPSSKLVVLPHFIPVQVVKESVRDIDVLFVGRLTAEKGVRILLEALSSIPSHRQAKIVGSGSLEGLVREYCMNTKNVQWIAHAPMKDLTSLYRRAKIIVVPSLWPENAPYVLLEAMSNGCIPVASAVGGIPELIRDRIEGRLLPPAKARQLSETLEEVLRDHGQQKKYQAAIAQRLRERHDPEIHIQKLFSLYRHAQRSRLA